MHHVDSFQKHASLVQAKPEGRLIHPHLTRDVVVATQLVGEVLTVCTQQQTIDATQRLDRQRLDLRIQVVELHQAGRVHLDPLEINALSANRHTHLDAIAHAMLTDAGRQVHQVRAILSESRVRRKVGTQTAARQNHRAV